MTSIIYTHNTDTSLEYNLYGSGANTLVCFHGFNETPRHFAFLEDNLKDYSIVSISLFYHGKSKRKTIGYLKQKEWQPIIEGLLNELKIERFSMLAYSMGGRFAISTFQNLHLRIDHMILIAPDGIIKRFWYEFATFPIGLNSLFFLIINHPSILFKFIKTLRSLKLLNHTVEKFTLNQLGTKHQRMLVYSCWTAFKHFTLKTSQLSQLINQNDTNCIFIFGQYDQVIKYKDHKKFLSSINYCSSYNLESGHQKLVQSGLKIIKNTLNN